LKKRKTLPTADNQPSVHRSQRR